MDEATRLAWENSPYGLVHRKAAEVEARRERENAERRGRWWSDALKWVDAEVRDPTERAALDRIREQCPNNVFGEAAVRKQAKKQLQERFRRIDWDKVDAMYAAGIGPAPVPLRMALP